ncbi:MAG: efflux RND transporter permease subunit [Deferribacteraceae bacterium]|jgi:HAE1 family hydrophobic/amphiphilic exporter-1|nr:efflux RND transporter permease subunit [Deferribacteraceae bacterium]
MFILKYALNNPVKVLVAVLFIFLFGIQALMNMPYQLSPTVEYPTISVRTQWQGATPYEMEREVIERQENVLKSLTGLMEMESTSGNGSGSITLQFELASDLMECMLLVSNKLNEVRNYPEDIEKPIIRASGGSDTTPVIYMIVELKDESLGTIDAYRTFVFEEVIPQFERIKGVSDVFFYGGRPTEMHITVVPEKLAAYKISLEKLSGILSRENINISGGLLPVGRQNYRVRTVSEFQSVDDINNTLVTTDSGDVRISDLAQVRYGYAARDSAVRYGGNRAMMVQVLAEPGANVLAMTDDVEKAVIEVNNTLLKDLPIRLQWMYDQRPYINGALEMVKGNIYLGGLLAVAVLLLFLRSFSSTLVIATSIPISIIGTFMIMHMLGRTLNVISLAGIAFAVGMLIDNAIVVLENIDRHSKMGKTPMQAALDGASEVWGAVLASTLTTIAVFLPVVFIKQEVGQLFRDIAIAISSAVTLSLIVSLLVVPVLTRLFGENLKPRKPMILDNKIAGFGESFSTGVMRLSRWINTSVIRSIAVVVVLVAFSALTVFALLPKMEYLPQGNMNMAQSRFVIPSGLSLDERTYLGDMFYEKVKEHMGVEKDGFPAVNQFSYNVNTGGMFAMATSTSPDRAAELLPLMSGLIKQIPGVQGFTTQAGIFQNRNNGGRSMDVVLSGEDIDGLSRAAGRVMELIQSAMPGVQVRSRPSVEMSFPEATFRPISERINMAGMTPTSLGIDVDVYVDGRKVGEYRDPILGNIDLIVNVEEDSIVNPEQLAAVPLPVADGNIVPISNVAELDISTGMDEIRHYERDRAFIIGVTPPPEMVLEELMDGIQEFAIEPLKESGVLDNIMVNYTGSASKLIDARDALSGNFLLAIVITFLLMAALFNNFFYPLIILFSVPMAMAGGFIGLKLVNLLITPQPFDILTMLGFIILIGVVVNNAILIVHQSLNNMRYGRTAEEALAEAVQSRLRPIAMGAATSVFGMLPLVVLSGAGSELYRGLGSVVLGGLLVSTIFTVFMIPALFSLTMKFVKK